MSSSHRGRTTKRVFLNSVINDAKYYQRYYDFRIRRNVRIDYVVCAPY